MKISTRSLLSRAITQVFFFLYVKLCQQETILTFLQETCMITTRSPLTPTMTPSQATGGRTAFLFQTHFLRRHPLYKKAWDAFEIEIPHLVKNSSVSGELKPDIKLIRLMKSAGGFVQGYQLQRLSLTLLISAHYQITFKRPHWNNSEGFIDAMEEICAAYKLLPAEEGLWGNVAERYVKHDFQVFGGKNKGDQVVSIRNTFSNRGSRWWRRMRTQ